MTRFYRFLDIHGDEACVNPDFISSIYQVLESDHYIIETSNGKKFKIRGDINIIVDSIETIANSKNYGT